MCDAKLIEEHNCRVLNGSMTPYKNRPCACCGSESSFAQHDVRRRMFYFIDEHGNCHQLRSWIVRWRCKRCKFLYTDIPPFAIPNKRFTRDSIIQVTHGFCANSVTTYRAPMPDQGWGKKSIELSPSTLWRWVSWMWSKPWIPMQVMQFALDFDQGCVLHRMTWTVESWKYRTKERGILVRHAYKFVEMLNYWFHEYPQKTPPTFQQPT